MAVFVVDGRGIVYEQLGEVDDFVWLRRIDDGAMDIRPKAMVVLYDPKPRPGEIWKANDTGADVIVIARNVAGGGWWVLPQPDGDVPASGIVTLLSYRVRDLTPKIRRARRREDINPDTVPPSPPPEATAAP